MSSSDFTRSLFGQRVLDLLPEAPSGWSRTYIRRCADRINRRITDLPNRLDSVAAGRVAPDADQVTIGSGRQFELSILFLDICAFTKWGNNTFSQQKTVLAVMNIFMAEMMNIVRDKGGIFEKNTGDGLMAYFGADSNIGTEKVRAAVEAATIMHYVNDHFISPWLAREGAWPVVFRIGIDVGPVTIGKVGVPGGLNSFVAIGTAANVANRLMRLIPEGGICIGESVYGNLPRNWYLDCTTAGTVPSYVLRGTQTPYRAWRLNHRLATPVL